MDQIRAELNAGRFPLFVSEGDSRGKFERIRHSAYLHKGLRSFAQNCRIRSAALFIYGHSLAANDDHVLRQIAYGKIEQLYVSLYGPPDSEENKAKVARAYGLANVREAQFPLKVSFFDAGEANVWGANG